MGRIKERGYLLFMYGKFKNDEKVKNILQELVPVVSSNAVKFTWGDYGIVAYFVSNTRFVELQDFIYSHMSGKCKQYFLTEKTDKLSVKINLVQFTIRSIQNYSWGQFHK